MTIVEGSSLTVAQEVRDILDRMGIEDSQQMSAGDVVELANILSEFYRLKRVLWIIEMAIEDEGKGGELYPVAKGVYSESEWVFFNGNGATLIEAVENYAKINES